MRYCRFCGAGMEDGDCYCSKCGRAVQEGQHDHHNHHNHHNHHPKPVCVEKEPTEKLLCELAYTGFLFWLPLVFCRDEKYAKQSANQGLWAVITATACCTAIQLADALNKLFAGSIIAPISAGIYSLLFIVFICFMLFLTGMCLRNVFQIHKDGELASILFFDSMAIFR